jgi:hypothetical protein
MHQPEPGQRRVVFQPGQRRRPHPGRGLTLAGTSQNRATKIGADNDIPHLPAALIDKYVSDL